MSNLLTVLNFTLLNPTPLLITTTDSTAGTKIVVTFIITLIILIAFAVLVAVCSKPKRNQNIPSKTIEEHNQIQDIDKNDNQPYTQKFTEQQKPTATQQAPATQAPTKSGHPFLKFLIAILIIGVAVFGVVKLIDCSASPENKDGITQVFSRSARVSDFNVSVPEDISDLFLKGQAVITPYSDIKGLELRFDFIDSSKSVLFSKIKSLGNVTANQSYYISFIDSLSFSETLKLLSLDDLKMTVTGGTVSYFN